MTYKTVFVISFLVGSVFLVKTCSATGSQYKIPMLPTFREVDHSSVRGPGGSYTFSFSLPQQARTEHRNSDGKVTGSYSFVDSFGQVITVHYTADENGYHPESHALPLAPRYTEEVALARERFFRTYQLRAKLHEQLASEESESSEESFEDSYEDYYDSSSEEDEESDEEDSREYGRKRS